MPKYTSDQFENELENMLKEAGARGESRVRIKAGDLHKRVVTPGDNRMPMACNAMRKVKSHQGDKAIVIYEPPAGNGPRFEIEFDTVDLPK